MSHSYIFSSKSFQKYIMKKFLLTTLFFLTFPIITYIFVICLWGDITNEISKSKVYFYPLGQYGHTYSRLKEVKTVKNVDILFVGSSHTYRGFDTRIFKNAGYKTFNLGSSSQTPIETQLLLDRYLKQLNPKLVVLEVYQETFIRDGVESSLDILANDKNDFNSVKMAMKINNKLTYNSLIYSFYRQFTHRNSCNEPREKKNDKYIDGGYVEKQLIYYHDTINYVPHDLVWNDKQFNAFEEILSDLSKKNIKIILVELPIISTLYNSYTNNDDFDNRMNHYGEYYNYNKLIHLNDSLDFFDDDHMNQNGVKVMNADFLKIIDKQFQKKN
jgi:hypothetical protein